MLALFRESIHDRKTNGVEANKDVTYKERLESLIDEEIDVGDKEKQKVFDTFRNGLDKRRDDIFIFLTNPLVPYDNNASERSLRPAKTKQKVSGQFKTMQGAQTYATLQSIIQTANKNNQSPYKALLAIAKHRE